MEPEKLKHLEFIQNVITRMNSNSFMIKGWTITLVSAVLAIYVTVQNDYLLLVGVIPIILFWFLDAYYLTEEKLFRCLYNKVIKEPYTISNFDMSIPEDCKKDSKNAYCNVFRSKTICSLYLSLLIVILIGFFSLKITRSQPQKQTPFQLEIKDTIKIRKIAPISIKADTLKNKYPS